MSVGKGKAARGRAPRVPAMLAGVVVTGIALGVGLLLDGGHFGQVLQPTAALIVLGGTAGAILVHFPWAVVREAVRALWPVLREPEAEQSRRSNEIVRMATQARRSGVASLDPEIAAIRDPFFMKAMMLAVDGYRADELREILDLEQMRLSEENERPARVWEAAGGFAPTLGILGAVLGLIQVMERLDDLSSVGHGIAVAFVATLYGVGTANLLFLPIAGRLRLRAREAQLLREITVEGVVAIAEGANARTTRERLGIAGSGGAVEHKAAKLVLQ